MRCLSRWLAPLLVTFCLGWGNAACASEETIINFDDLPDRQPVTNQYANQGVHFSSATILRRDGGLNFGSFPPRSGLGVVYDFPTGTITTTFDHPQTRVGGYVTGNTNVTLRAFNADGQLVGSSATGGANYVGSGTGRPANIKLEVTSAAADIIRVTFSDSGNTYTIDDFFFEGGCPDVPGVVLPEVTVPLLIPQKRWQIQYGQLVLDFTASSGNLGSDVSCQWTSNEGRLPVRARPVILGLPIGPYFHFADSIASATVTIYKPGRVGPLPTFSFFGARNNSLLNGPYVPGAAYAKWSTSGFTTEIFGSQPSFLQTGPLTFWVNLDALGLSSSSHETLLRTLEPYIHVTLISNLPLITAYTIIQDPGQVTLRVTDEHGMTTGILPGGATASEIPKSFYYTSEINPAVVIPESGSGSYEVVVTGVRDGDFALSISRTILPTGEVREASIQGTIAQGVSLVYAMQVDVAEGGAARVQAAPGASLVLLREHVSQMVLENGLGRSLLAKLTNVQAALDSPNADRRKDAINKLRAFQSEANAQRGKHLSASQANLLTAWSESLIAQIKAQI